MDDFLNERLQKYDRWLAEGRISFSSKIIPVGTSLQAQQWVLPTEQVLNILRDARSFALQNCVCRVHYARCNKPAETCFMLDELGDKLVTKGLARRVSLTEATEVLYKADEHGLIHMSLYIPDHKIASLCNCCPCCCHDIQLLKMLNRGKDMVVRSEYVSETDAQACIHCGACVERCAFEARTLVDGQMTYNAEKCLGCGLCVSVCPASATLMRERKA
jgi:ferredoxin